MSLTREEVERRLKRWSGVKPNDPSYLRDSGQREALETALAAMDERDEAIQRGVSNAVALGKCQGERDALAAEGRLLAQWLVYPPRNTSETANWNYPNITAEVQRVKRLEAVLEAAKEVCLFEGNQCLGDLDTELGVAIGELETALAALDKAGEG